MPLPLQLEIGTRTPSQLVKEMEEKGMKVSDYAKEMIKKIKEPKKETVELAVVKVRDLGFTEMQTTTELFERAKERGYELCHPIIGLELRLAYEDQPMNDWLYVGMKPISVSGGSPGVFSVDPDGDGLWLSGRWTWPGGQWNLGSALVFRVRKSDSLPLGRLDSLIQKSEDMTRELKDIRSHFNLSI